MNPRDSRQGFLGPNARERIDACRVGIVGYGGGGSHVGLQLAHVGFPLLTLFEPQAVENTNLNRLVAACENDVGGAKLEVAARVISGLVPMSGVRLVKATWQEHAHELKECDVVVGCVDKASQRSELERECRRWLIPYIDIGMGVRMPQVDAEDPLVSGQMSISVPGLHCLRCFGVITEQALANEQDGYGDTAPAPQVVWPNGVLGSLAVGAVVEIATRWRKQGVPHAIVRFQGDGTVAPPRELEFTLPVACLHFPVHAAGPAQVARR